MATVTTQYNYTGGYQTFNVPNNVTSVSVEVYGASCNGIRGGSVTGTISGLSGSNTLTIICGQNGNGGVSGSGSNAGGAATWGGGGAGGAGYNADGGWSGGGYSGIRLDSTSGTVKCAAGGAGGRSGDGGAGGVGGAGTGATGQRGTAGSGAATGGTGGTQSGGGNGGTSSSGGSFTGGAGSDTVFGRGGTGGDTGGYNGPGGGGGGGGYHCGGGGAGGSSGYAPGCGGGGGSNYTGGLSGSTSSSDAHTGDGLVTVTYTVPRPNNPTITTPGVGQRMKSTSITFAATVSDPNNHMTYAEFRYSTDSSFGSYSTATTTSRGSPGSASVTVSGLPSNTHYYVRCYAYDDTYDIYSSSYDTADFYTNYAPATPTAVVPSAGTRTLDGNSMSVSCTVSDPDGGNSSSQLRALFRYSTSSSFTSYTDIFSGYVSSGAKASATLTGLSPNTHYYLRVYAYDDLLYSASYVSTDFYTNTTPSSPTLDIPADGSSLLSSTPQTFTWDFNDIDPNDYQTQADFQYREYNVGDPWTVQTVSMTTAGTTTFPANTFPEGRIFEWQVRTYDSNGLVGPWSNSLMFSTVKAFSNGVQPMGEPGVSVFPTRGLAL